MINNQQRPLPGMLSPLLGMVYIVLQLEEGGLTKRLRSNSRKYGSYPTFRSDQDEVCAKMTKPQPLNTFSPK